MFAPYMLLERRSAKLEAQVEALNLAAKEEGRCGAGHEFSVCRSCGKTETYVDRRRDYAAWHLEQTRECMKLLTGSDQEKVYAVKIEQAKEPETYQFENLQYGNFITKSYQCCGGIISAVLLLVCVVLVLFAYSYQGRTDYVDNCPGPGAFKSP